MGWGEWVGVPISPGHPKNYGHPVYGGELMEGFCPDGGGGLWCRGGGGAKNLMPPPSSDNPAGPGGGIPGFF